MTRGYFGVGVYHIKSEVNLGTLFRSAQCFGADFIFTVGRRYKDQASDTMKARNHLPLYNYSSFEDLREHLPDGCRIVGVELTDRAWSLGQYVHPERCVYLLGAEDHGIPAKQLEMCHDVVQIPGASHCLNVASAGSIVMYDRATQTARYKTRTNTERMFDEMYARQQAMLKEPSFGPFVDNLRIAASCPLG